MPSTPTLTIAIPTYARNELLNRNIDTLIDQAADAAARGAIEVTILDNASPVPVGVTLPSLPSWISIQRNRVNIGGNANMLRCFETCRSQWLWVIGDDDAPTPGAVERALASIARHPQAVAIVHAVQHKVVRHKEWQTYHLDDLLESLDDFGNLLFLPSTLYRIEPLLPFFDIGYHYSYSCAPHLALLLSALARDGGNVVFTTGNNIAYERPETENRGWIIPIALGLPTLLEVPLLSSRGRRLIAKHLAQFPSIGSLVHQALLRMQFGISTQRDELHYYLQALYRYPISYSPLRRILGLLPIPLLLIPKASYPLIAWIYRLKTGHASGSHKLPLNRL